jgi:glucosamine--fructose-6-phosphate aminotransferase (isomerizing)
VALDVLSSAASLITIGRGPTLAIAREAALKLKETCHLQAEPFSGAEFQHGPMTLVSPRYPILMFIPGDSAAAGMRELAEDLKGKGATLFCTQHGEGGTGNLSALAPDHPDVDAVCLIQTFYALTIRLAALRGIDVERPRHLRKVTRTR